MAENTAENVAAMEIKLMIDPISKKLIFSEASKDFIDFLFVLLSLPIGTAIKLLTTEESTVLGSISNIYTSVTNLDPFYLQPNIQKDAILNPMVLSPVTNVQLSITGSSISDRIYTCLNTTGTLCKTNFTNIYGAKCSNSCGYTMSKEIKFSGSRSIFIEKEAKNTKGYVKEYFPYMISDDLSVTPISTMSIFISLMDKLNVSKLEERKVKVGTKEALEILKISFKSPTVLSDVFLKP